MSSLLRNVASAPMRAWKKTRIYAYFTFEPDRVPLGDVVQSAFEQPTELLSHLNELRIRLFWIFIFLIVGSLLAFFFVTPIMQFLAGPLPGGIDALSGVDVTEPVGAVMWVVVLSGFTISFPFMIVQVWLFFAPGLTGRERLWTMLSLPFAVAFFLSGVAFTYYVLLPQALPMLTNFMGLQTTPRPITYFPFVVNLMLWLGLAFEFPVVAMILGRLGILKAADLLRFWRYAVIVIAIIASVITTTVDPANMILAMLPMLGLYFLSIGLVAIVQKPRR